MNPGFSKSNTRGEDLFRGAEKKLGQTRTLAPLATARVRSDRCGRGIISGLACYSLCVPRMNTSENKADFRQAALVHLDALYGFAMALTHNQTEAEDLTQETYLRAMRAFGQLVPDSNLKSWLFTIMRNVWRNKLRHDRRGPQFVELDSESSHEDEVLQVDASGGDPLTILVRKVEREGVRGAIAQLPPAYREIVVLRDLEGFSYQQIATILECPAGTVMSRLSRAREQLRLLLSEPKAAAVPK